MKAILFIILISTSCLAFAQTIKPITEFSGLKFGCDSDGFKAGIQRMGGKFWPQQSSPGVLAFTNVPYGTRKTVFFKGKFVDNKMYEVDLVFANDTNASAILYFNALITDVNKIYGKGSPSMKINPPYKEGDGKELEAIKSGNAQYIYYWYDDRNKNKIAVTIDRFLTVYMVYVDSELSN